MGSYASMYLGPYFECAHKNETQSETVHDVCINQDCWRYTARRYIDGAFCLVCGGKLGTHTRLTAKRPDIAELTNEQLRTAGDRVGKTVCLTPNVSRKGDPGRFIEDSFALDLRGVDMAAEMAWLDKAFAKERKKLEAAFASVETKWGLHRWYS